ncbi:fibromodulin [Xyrichtys novacula]|uniref:Fibromodulin n=1 Tax=Xyrichtys novacula TaxID=13765 RepID=A0AAV1HGJ5_XYRNO|nr:fibromodulin [Xyrichtys novacula]
MCSNESGWRGLRLRQEGGYLLYTDEIFLQSEGDTGEVSKKGGFVSDLPTVVMRTVVLFLIMGQLELGVSQQYSQFQWLSQLRGRRRHAGWQAEDVDCPLECDCPSAYPTAMYCHGRNLQHVPYVPSHIKYAYLQRNQITTIQDGVFDNATSLVWIVLFHNQLSSDKIGKNVFSKLKDLDQLYLDHNELTRVPPNLPKSITTLRLGHNKISKIGSNSLEGMADLTTLQLQANAIEDVGGVFKGLKSLTLLDMRKNKLKKIPENLPEKLQQLYLEFNNIESVPAGFLSLYPKLHFVRLAHNKLTDKGLPSNVFNVSTLVELDLSFNRLERIPVVNRNLENLYLHANKIKEFSLNSFCSTADMRNFSRLRMLRLDANKISARDIPAEAAYCLRRVAFIDV